MAPALLLRDRHFHLGKQAETGVGERHFGLLQSMEDLSFARTMVVTRSSSKRSIEGFELDILDSNSVGFVVDEEQTCAGFLSAIASAIVDAGDAG